MSDAVNHPSHYAEGRKYEPIDVFDAWNAGFNVGNCLKYISRMSRKSTAPPLEDLEKARFYLNHEIEMRNTHPEYPFYPLVNNSEYKPDVVVEDWNLNTKLSTVVILCYMALCKPTVKEYIDGLNVALFILNKECNDLRATQESEAEEFKNNIK